MRTLIILPLFFSVDLIEDITAVILCAQRARSNWGLCVDDEEFADYRRVTFPSLADSRAGSRVDSTWWWDGWHFWWKVDKDYRSFKERFGGACNKELEASIRWKKKAVADDDDDEKKLLSFLLFFQGKNLCAMIC